MPFEDMFDAKFEEVSKAEITRVHRTANVETPSCGCDPNRLTRHREIPWVENAKGAMDGEAFVVYPAPLRGYDAVTPSGLARPVISVLGPEPTVFAGSSTGRDAHASHDLAARIQHRMVKLRHLVAGLVDVVADECPPAAVLRPVRA